MIVDPKHRSRIITDGRDRAGARAMLKGIGLTDDDLARPIVGVANSPPVQHSGFSGHQAPR
jgi:dihydroxy-acid dehydratase